MDALPCMTPAPCLHADDHLLVCDKPAGLLAVPGRGPDKADCLLARLLPAYPDAQVVHRLDMATSGLMVFARGAAAQRALSMAFEARQVGKRYVAVVAGRMGSDAGEIDLPVGADWPARPQQMVDEVNGKPSVTRWRALGEVDGPWGAGTRLELEPVTGRTHQLRVHLAAIGHPIVGDGLYAPAAVAQAAPRLLLHAWRLAVPHPGDGQVSAFEARLPL